MRSDSENRLVLPWEEERKRFPWPLKFIWALFAVFAVVSIFINQCSVSGANTLDAYTAGHDER